MKALMKLSKSNKFIKMVHKSIYIITLKYEDNKMFLFFFTVNQKSYLYFKFYLA